MDNKFAVLLAERLLKVTDVAKGTGVSRVTLTSLYYKKSKGITFDVLEKVCNFLDCEPNDLLKIGAKKTYENEN